MKIILTGFLPSDEGRGSEVQVTVEMAGDSETIRMTVGEDVVEFMPDQLWRAIDFIWQPDD